MKKIFIFAATAALLASCAKDELINEVDPSSNVEQAIGFSTFANLTTRNAENDKDAVSKSGLENYYDKFLVWGYKNVATATSGVYTPTAVFGKVTLTWDEAPELPFNVDGDWVYSPIRYWDKAATNYDFHAAAPDDDAFVWHPTTTTATGTDAEGTGYFTYENATVKGESLPMDKVVTGQKADDADEYYDKFTTDKDLMIAEDVVKQLPSSYIGTATAGTSATHVHFDFDHILSRLNIGVKIGTGITVKYDTKDEEFTVEGETPVTYTVYVSAANAAKLYAWNGEKYYELTETADSYDVGGEVTPVEDDLVPRQVEDKTKPTDGVVLLKNVSIVKLAKQGSFNENLADADDGNGITAAQLAAGTTKRWTIATDAPKTTDVAPFGFPNTQVPGVTVGTVNKVVNLSADQDLTNGETAVVADYKYVYQGLVIPQVLEYEDVKLDGSNIESCTKPYIKVVYTLDDEEYTAYYNLAAVFSNVYDQYKITKDSEDYAAYFTDKTGEYAYENSGAYYTKDIAALTIDGYWDGTKYYGIDGKILEEQPGSPTGTYLKCIATPIEGSEAFTCTRILVTRADAQKGGVSPEECNIPFNEGWQNNLRITISPTAILFSAEVYEWETWMTDPDTDDEITVE